MAIEDQAVLEAARAVDEAKKVVILTGAGMSTEAGVPDFRSQNGWWKQIDPRTVATTEALEGQYGLFHDFYSFRIRSLGDVRPHSGHAVIAKWEKQGKAGAVATQNVDGLHQAAGSRQVYELHGSILSCRCHACGRPAAQGTFLDKEACPCGGKLRPNVVLFGESLPSGAWDMALNRIERADLVIVIGTSLTVYPVNQLPYLTKGKRILINMETTGEENRFDLVLLGKAGEILEAVDRSRGQ